MPQRKRLEEEKQNGLLKASKSVLKVKEMSKRQTVTAVKLVSMPEEALAVFTIPIKNVSLNNSNENNDYFKNYFKFAVPKNFLKTPLFFIIYYYIKIIQILKSSSFKQHLILEETILIIQNEFIFLLRL